MKRVILTLFSLGLLTSVFSQKITIPLKQGVVKGSEMNINPGDTLLLEGGTRTSVRFSGINGTSGQPVVIINGEEKVIIDTEAHTAIHFEECSFIHLTGTGNDEDYGIEVAGSGSMGVNIAEYSTDIEIDHLRIRNTGFAGIMAKTDPNCGRQDLRDFVMKNLSFHDNYISETEGEGFYVGYSWYPTRSVDCDGQEITLYPHAIHGVRLYDNIIKNTGWDGLQVGSATADVKIYGNYIENYGMENKEWQNHAVQIGEGTTGELYNNFIINGSGGGVSFFGSGNNRLYNNVIVNTGENSIYQNDKGARPGTKYEIYNNTLINPQRAVIELTAKKTTGNLVANNIMVLGEGFFGLRNDDNRWKSEANVLYNKVEDVGFVDPENNDFRLKDGSKAIDIGHGITHLKFDHDFYERPANGKLDLGAFEFASEPYVAPALGIENDQEIRIFPNPVQDVLKIKMDGTAFPDSIIMYDQMGKVVLNKALDLKGKKEFELDLNQSWPAGIYYFNLYEKSRHLGMTRLVVEKED